MALSVSVMENMVPKTQTVFNCQAVTTVLYTDFSGIVKRYSRNSRNMVECKGWLHAARHFSGFVCDDPTHLPPRRHSSSCQSLAPNPPLGIVNKVAINSPYCKLLSAVEHITHNSITISPAVGECRQWQVDYGRKYKIRRERTDSAMCHANALCAPATRSF